MSDAPFRKHDTRQQNEVASVNGCFICGKKPTMYMVDDKGYCFDHKLYAVDARTKLTRIFQSYAGMTEGSLQSMFYKRNHHKLGKYHGKNQVKW